MRFFWMSLLVLTAGCGSSSWAKKGAGREEFAVDKQGCNLYARAMNQNESAFSGAWHNHIFGECMRERGWAETETN